MPELYISDSLPVFRSSGISKQKNVASVTSIGQGWFILLPKACFAPKSGHGYEGTLWPRK